MTYPRASAEQIAFFEEHGFLVVADAIPSAHLDELERRCDRLLDDRERLANDWAWDEAESLEERSFRIVQSSPSFVWRDIAKAPYRIWLAEFGEALMRRRLEFWYDQFLAKPPGRSVPTAWHQDEGYWGRNLDNRGVTAWIPLQDVDPTNGCMHFIDRPPTGRSASSPGRGHAERPADLRGGRAVDGRLPDPPRRCHVPPLQDAAHDPRQYGDGVAQGGQQSPTGGGSWRRGRPLSLEDHG